MHFLGPETSRELQLLRGPRFPFLGILVCDKDLATRRLVTDAAPTQSILTNTLTNFTRETCLLQNITVGHAGVIVGAANQAPPRLVQAVDVLLGEYGISAAILLSEEFVCRAFHKAVDTRLLHWADVGLNPFLIDLEEGVSG